MSNIDGPAGSFFCCESACLCPNFRVAGADSTGGGDGLADCVMIDPAYDGRVFNIALSDVPETKSDLVSGKYDLPSSKGKTTVAVKIVDMLGEEVLEQKQV